MTDALIWVENGKKLRFGYDWNGCSKPSHGLIGMEKQCEGDPMEVGGGALSLVVVSQKSWRSSNLILCYGFCTPFLLSPIIYILFKSRFGHFPSLASFLVGQVKLTI